MILASDEIFPISKDKNTQRLEKLMKENLNEKIKHSEIFSINTVRKSLLIGAKIKLKTISLSTRDSVLLNQFVERGGIVSDPFMYTEISNIVK